MNLLEILLPYALLLIAAVVSFFIKGNIVNKIVALVFFAAGMFCIGAESGWWRFGYIIVILLICSEQRRVFQDRTGGPVYICMGLVICLMMTIKWIIYTLVGFDPFWWLMIVAIYGSYVYLANADNE